MPTRSVEVSEDGAVVYTLVHQGDAALNVLGKTSELPISIPLFVDGAGDSLTTGVKNDFLLTYQIEIIGWTINADQSGNAVLDVQTTSYDEFPLGFSSICGSEKPTLSGAQKNQDTALSTWETTILENTFIRLNVDAASTVERVTLNLHALRSF
jgi:hypothetical protein